VPPRLPAATAAVLTLAGVWICLVGLLVAAGEVITRSAGVTGFDRRVTLGVVDSRTSTLNSVMRAVTWLGSWVALVSVALVVVLLVMRKRLPVRAAIVAVLAWAGEAFGVRIAKEAVTRARPPKDIWLVTAHGWSFPSGHAATASLAFTGLALCVAAGTRHRLVRALGWLIAVLAIAATAYSRVELGVHWTTDVIAGIIFVACWLTALLLAGGRPPCALLPAGGRPPCTPPITGGLRGPPSPPAVVAAHKARRHHTVAEVTTLG
jgi:undecaprenyl-diphosphatase